MNMFKNRLIGGNEALMTRISLSQKLNTVEALLLGFLFWFTYAGIREYPGHEWILRWYDAVLIPAVLGANWLFTAYVNRRWLGWFSRRCPYCGAYFLSLAYLHLSCWTLTIALELSTGRIRREIGDLEPFFSQFFAMLAAPVFIMFTYFAPLTIFAWLVSGSLAGFLLKYLYQRRDYLPEGDAK